MPIPAITKTTTAIIIIFFVELLLSINNLFGLVLNKGWVNGIKNDPREKCKQKSHNRIPNPVFRVAFSGGRHPTADVLNPADNNHKHRKHSRKTNTDGVNIGEIPP